MEKKDITGLGVIGVLLLTTIFGFLPGEDSTHVCIPEEGDYIDMKCDRLSSTGKTCYPNADTRRGSKYCGGGWKAIDRSDIGQQFDYVPATADWICTKDGCTPA